MHLDVAMHNILLVHVLETQQRLADHMRRLVLAVLFELNDAVKQFANCNSADK
jgi:hypothetical protein